MTDAIILAAGNSKRFGKDNKLFTDFNSTLLITHVVSEICRSKLRNIIVITGKDHVKICLLYTSPSPRDLSTYRMPSYA